MRVQHVALVAAAAMASSTHGLQGAPDSAESPSLQTIVEAKHEPLVDSRIDRFLISESNDLPLLVASAGYALPLSLQEGGNGRHLRVENDVSPGETRSWGNSKRTEEQKPGWLTRIYRYLWRKIYKE
uniref:Uncharacterized protein n=1 Tax=Peronospora matthiolae TaxID=2874970 RepID=A0AAV1V5Y6_9STRA